MCMVGVACLFRCGKVKMGVALVGCALIAVASGGGRSPAPNLVPLVLARGYVAGVAGGNFGVSLRAGQLFHATVNQHDLDLAVCLYTPKGALAAAVDAFEYGSESISHVAEIDGVYRIEVVPVDRKSPRL